MSRKRPEDPTHRTVGATVVACILAVAFSLTAGWGALALGGHTDAAGRMGLALGASVFVLVLVGYRRGARGFLQGLLGAVAVGGVLLGHFWARLHRLP